VSGYVLLLAHGDGWFQAAADNGAGTAAVLRAAEVLAARKPQTGVVVAIADAEEVGLVGSRVLAERLRAGGIAVPDGGPPVRMQDLKAVVNLDASSARASDAQALPRGIVGGDAPVFSWRAIVSSDGSALGALFATRAAQHGVFGLPVGARAWLAAIGSWRTDAGWFDDAGVPVVWPVAGYPEYHTDGDTFATVDPVDLENVALAAADTVSDAASLPSAAR
jgi:Zn-dependent M28 family amino/carboxypeptidase